MNAILGSKIRSLREEKGLTQEQVAEKLNCTRQKYARLEKGLIDISYATITAVAEIFAVTTDEITAVVNKKEQEQLAFRKNGCSYEEDKSAYITEMIDTFYAHRKLYNSVRQVNVDE